jgi:Family of unknown function (DUF6495)
MAKYRALNSIELEALQEDFIKFLVLNGITAQDWLSIKENQPLVSNGLIEAFSDVVFEGIVRKVDYLEYSDPSGFKIFKCDVDEITLIGLENVSNVPNDFRDLNLFFEHVRTHPESFTIFKTSKKYFPDKSTEIFKMISSGAIVSNKTWYETLEKMC